MVMAHVSDGCVAIGYMVVVPYRIERPLDTRVKTIPKDFIDVAYKELGKPNVFFYLERC